MMPFITENELYTPPKTVFDVCNFNAQYVQSLLMCVWFAIWYVKPGALLKPQDSFGRFVKNFLDLQKVDHTIRKHH